MIATIEKSTNESNGVLEAHNFKIADENLGTIFHILRSQIYSNAPLAVVREISTNSLDAHVEAGKPNLPIQVSLPTQLDSFLKIRDFGNALSDEQIKDIYTSYGASTKRNTNKQIGQMGLGSKSPMAYTDSFIVNSYRGGVLTSWNTYLDESKRGAMAKMVEDKTTEPDGLEIVVPVKSQDINKFIESAFNLFSYWKIKPVLLNLNDDQKAAFKARCEKVSLFEGKSWKLVGGGRSVAVMGNIPYPINMDSFIGEELKNPLRNLVSNGIVLEFKIGDVEFSSSRESLSYSNKTKKSLVSALEAAHKELISEIDKKFKGCTSLWDAKILYKSIFDSSGPLYSIRQLFDRQVKFNGEILDMDDFYIGHFYKDTKQTPARSIRLAECVCFSKKDDYGHDKAKVARKKAEKIKVSPQSLVLVNDKKIVNGILNRVVGLIETKQYQDVYILSFACEALTDADAQKEWFKLSKLDCELKNLSDLPKEPLSKYYPDCGNSPRLLAFPSSTLEFEYNRNPKASGAYGTKNSDWWTATTLDVTKDSGVYLVIESFEYKNQLTWNESPKRLRDQLETLEYAGIIIPKIYGLKIKATEKIGNNKNMVSFWVWAKQAVADKLKATEKDYVDYRYVKTKLFTSIGNLDSFIKIKWSENPTSPLVKLIGNIKASYDYKNDSKMENLTSLLQTYQIPVTKASINNLDKDIQSSKDRYPLVFELWKNAYYEIHDNKPIIKSIREYVDLVDAAKP